MATESTLPILSPNINENILENYQAIKKVDYKYEEIDLVLINYYDYHFSINYIDNCPNFDIKDLIELVFSQNNGRLFSLSYLLLVIV